MGWVFRHFSSHLCLQLIIILQQWTGRRCPPPLCQAIFALQLYHFPKFAKSAKASCLDCETIAGFIIPIPIGIPMFIPIPIMPWLGIIPIMPWLGIMPIPIPIPAPGCIIGFTGGLTVAAPRLIMENPWGSMLAGAWLPRNDNQSQYKYQIVNDMRLAGCFELFSPCWRALRLGWLGLG